MLNTLSEIMDEPTMAPTASPTVSKPASLWTSIPMWLVVALIVGLALYFLPFLLNYLSLPEQIVEKKVKKEIDSSKKKKTIREDELEVDAEGILEERGYCYIGTDRGVRSCIDVTPGDKCMSGKIFPRRDICVNPNLRL